MSDPRMYLSYPSWILEMTHCPHILQHPGDRCPHRTPRRQTQGVTEAHSVLEQPVPAGSCDISMGLLLHNYLQLKMPIKERTIVPRLRYVPSGASGPISVGLDVLQYRDGL